MALREIGHLQTGMTAAADVYGRSGQLLVAAGTVLTGQHLLALRTWGISCIDVISNLETGLEGNEDPIDTRELEQTREQLLPRFRFNDTTHSVIAELLRLAILRKASRED